jgi:hypothetical protein
MKSISSKRCWAGLEVNWTRFLGQVMVVCVSHYGQRRYCISNYKAVFRQKYHPTLKCSLAEMHECWSISQRLWLNSDERLKKYVRKNDIVDIELDESGLAAAFDDDDEDDEEYEWTHPSVELDKAAFPALIQMKTMMTRLLMFMMLSKLMHRKTRLVLLEKHQHLQTSQLRR